MSQPAVPAHIRVSVPQSALQRGQLGAPSQLRAVLEHLKPRRRVSIEAHEHAAPTAVLYAPDIAPTTGHPYTPTEFVAVHPVASSGSLVHAHEAFEIRVVGLIAAPHDALGDHNELLVYSLCADPGGQDEVPYVHLAPDDPGASAPPGQFVPVPSSKALFLAHRGEPRREIFCRFAVAEVDEVGEAATAAIEGIGQLGSFAQQFGASIPHFGMLSPAVHLASLVGKNALDSYAKNDSVLDTDFRFLLAGAGEGLDPETSAINGDFLRYGYYFFLSRPVDGTLYATTGVSSQSVSLMLKRVDKWSGDESEFFPLTEVSYLVMRVSRGCAPCAAKPRRKPVNLEHAQRIKAILEESGSSNAEDSADDILRQLKELATDLGVSA